MNIRIDINTKRYNKTFQEKSFFDLHNILALNLGLRHKTQHRMEFSSSPSTIEYSDVEYSGSFYMPSHKSADINKILNVIQKSVFSLSKTNTMIVVKDHAHTPMIKNKQRLSLYVDISVEEINCFTATLHFLYMAENTKAFMKLTQENESSDVTVY